MPLRKYTTQPQYLAEIDWSHKILRGVSSSIITYGGGNSWKKHQGQRILQPTLNGTPATSSSHQGQSLLFNGSNTYLDYGAGSIPTTEFTILWGGVFYNLDGFRGLIDCTVNGSSGWNIFAANGDTLWFSANQYSGHLSSNGWPLNKPVHGALRNKLNVSSDWFRNGAIVASTNGAGPNPVATPLWVGNQRGGGATFLSGSLSYLYLIDKYLDDASIIELQSNPWQILKYPARRYRSVVSIGGSTYTISPSGSITLSGTTNPIRTKVFLPTGDINFSGNSKLIKEKIILPQGTLSLSGSSLVTKTKIIESSGTVSFTGTSPIIRSKIIESSGGVNFSGTASLSGATSYILTPIGGVTFNGSSSLIKTHIQIPTGKISFSGNSPVESNTVIITVSTRLPLTGVGK